MRAVPVALLGLLCAACASGPGTDAESFPVPQIEWAPLHHACPRATGSVVIDGRLDDAAWVRAPWTSDFRDIRGGSHPTPRFRTRAKMLWDDEFLYLGAELSEPDVWGTLVDRDSVVYQDNDFEIFIDPDGDTHEYYELEINALGTEWDLLVPKPYRDAGHGVNAWDIRGLRTAVHVDGTLNRPGDRDLGWSVEIAIPWGVLAECANREAPPKPGDTWRMNFSRVEWRTRVTGGRYEKENDPATGEPLPEDNWVWSPQGLVAMHYPEMWGFVTFVADPTPGAAFDPGPDERARWALRLVYYRMREYRARFGHYHDRLPGLPSGISLRATPNLFEAEAPLSGGRRMRITQDGRVRIVEDGR